MLKTAVAVIILAIGLINSAYCAELSFKSVEKDGWEVTRSVPEGPIPLNGYFYRESRKPPSVSTLFTFTWYYLGVDGSGTLRMQRRERSDLKETEPRVELFARRHDDRQGMWKVFLFATVDYTAELEFKDLGDSRVAVKLLNPPKQK